ncbi:hypothetical protein PILCRDRAFT_747154 [Piloderma croceum F 1598]|uniref:Uncharacterized protein n=1 Tax=Piloderma croceum (strain F 1598) TaxID=765440 RepID=A0A0C3EVV2_PILCF|nr:hypothetical protein PILCRDRAFT_747154 [Piloderma croceum F 1598]
MHTFDGDCCMLRLLLETSEVVCGYPQSFTLLGCCIIANNEPSRDIIAFPYWHVIDRPIRLVLKHFRVSTAHHIQTPKCLCRFSGSCQPRRTTITRGFHPGTRF